MEHVRWPGLALAQWEPTYLTLHRWTQVVGKVQLALAPPLNHWWHVSQRVTTHGLTTGSLCGEDGLTIEFDFVRHRLMVEAGDHERQSFALEPMTVAAFYDRLLGVLDRVDIHPHIWPVPVEIKDATPFPNDKHHASYDPRAVERFHRALLSINRVFERHRGHFLGKSSPSHFFWGGFDLAVTRFSGRRNPKPPTDAIQGPAYSHEVISHGFWPGGDFLDRGRIEEPIFYDYAVPEPLAFKTARVEPPAAHYDAKFGEFVLPYEAVRTADDPEGTLFSFMETTYLAGARAAAWPVEDLAA
jgi:hypothetical protein